MQTEMDSSGPKTQPQKPWKQKRKSVAASSSSNDIQIYEGKPAVEMICSVKPTSAEDGYIRIISADGFEFVIPSKVVDHFECIDLIFRSDAAFKEKLENLVYFPELRPEVLESVLRFVFIDHLNKLKAESYWGFETPRLVFQFEVEPKQVMDIIYAAHFLGIKELLNVASTMVAHHLEDVLDLSSIPGDLAWCIAEKLSPQELLAAEERPDFLALNLEMDILWEKHCKKLFEDEIIVPVSPSEDHTSYESWGINECPPPTSWKSLYISKELQQLQDCQIEGEMSNFLKEVAYKGKCAHSHMVLPMFWEWVLKKSSALSLVNYVACFSNLLSLSLANLSLGIQLASGTMPCSSFGDILKELPLLQLLDLSDTGCTVEASVHLGKALQSHERLQVLRLAFNAIQTKGFVAIARALASARTLRLLDVRANGISVLLPDDAVEILGRSALRELLLDGNFGSTSGRNSSSQGPCSLAADQPSQRSADNFSALQEGMFENKFTSEVVMLSTMPENLIVLQLSKCSLTDGRVNILSQGLLRLKQIKKLDLSDNKITSDGAISVFRWLNENESLLELDLGQNIIAHSSTATEVLCETLRRHKFIEKLSLRGSFTYGEEHILQVLSAASKRGHVLELQKNIKFQLDLRSTDFSHLTRGRIRPQSSIFPSLHLLL
eukprot:Gb_40339 [translate_table: standard]